MGSVTGSLLGIIALVIGALFNFWLTRRRVARIRSEEADAVAAALFGEIVLFREELARVAKFVAGIVANHRDFDEHFLEHIHLQEPALYKALSAKVGLLEASILLPIITFHNRVQSVRDWLPQLVENKDRKYSYSPLTVLEPAISGIEDILPILNLLASRIGVTPPVQKPEMGYAYAILETERDRFAN